jgi:SNF2 family DNA or RNA helicase
MGGFENRQVIEYQNLDELHTKFYSIAHRVTIEEAVDLPEYNDVPLSVDLCPKAKKIYMQLERELIAECDNGQISTDNVLTKLLRLAQIAGGILRLDDGRVETIDTSKTDMAMEIIKDLPPTEPVVIFARFRPELKRMQEELTGIGRTVGEISGRTKSPDDLVGGVWTANSNNTLLVQIAAGGEGLDFTVSKYCIYLSKGYSNGQIKQSRARIHRPGQKRTVTYFNINAKGTVDVRIDQAIRFKNKITNSVLDIKDIVLNSLKEMPDAEHGEVDEVCEAV